MEIWKIACLRTDHGPYVPLASEWHRWDRLAPCASQPFAWKCTWRAWNGHWSCTPDDPIRFNLRMRGQGIRRYIDGMRFYTDQEAAHIRYANGLKNRDSHGHKYSDWTLMLKVVQIQLIAMKDDRYRAMRGRAQVGFPWAMDIILLNMFHSQYSTDQTLRLMDWYRRGKKLKDKSKPDYCELVSRTRFRLNGCLAALAPQASILWVHLSRKLWCT